MALRTRGQRRHEVLLENPVRVADGDGGYTESWVPCDPPRMMAAIESASTGDLERLTGATILATAPFLIVMDFHADVGMQTRITKLYDARGPRVFEVAGLQNPADRDLELAIAATELVR
jgi:head-tail adaptor